MSQEHALAEHDAEAQGWYHRVGEITRQLHDALRELGYDKQIEGARGRGPVARARLSFIARLTGDAAEKVLDTVDAAQAQQEALAAQAQRMHERLLGDPSGALASGELLDFVSQVQANAQHTSSQLTEIMMAQDFHDLTGQTVCKVVEIASGLEKSLVQLLLDTSPPAEAAPDYGPMSGPVAEPSARADVVADQAQVDDLLESLGF